jgi:hypothetical protein
MRNVMSNRYWLTAWIALSSCSEAEPEAEVPCTDELRTAVIVSVRSPQGLPTDDVTATRGKATTECTSWPLDTVDAGADSAMYFCSEQGGGTYRVRVTSGDLTWTQSVDVEADVCHVRKAVEVEFVLDPEQAD